MSSVGPQVEPTDALSVSVVAPGDAQPSGSRDHEGSADVLAFDETGRPRTEVVEPSTGHLGDPMPLVGRFVAPQLARRGGV